MRRIAKWVWTLGFCASAGAWCCAHWFGGIGFGSPSLEFGDGVFTIHYSPDLLYSGPYWLLGDYVVSLADEDSSKWGLTWPRISKTREGPNPVIRVFTIEIPLWMPTLTLALLTVRSWRRSMRYPRPGCCRRCGYDLTGNTSGVCSECGAPTPPTNTPPPPASG